MNATKSKGRRVPKPKEEAPMIARPSDLKRRPLENSPKAEPASPLGLESTVEDALRGLFDLEGRAPAAEVFAARKRFDAMLDSALEGEFARESALFDAELRESAREHEKLKRRHAVAIGRRPVEPRPEPKRPLMESASTFCVPWDVWPVTLEVRVYAAGSNDEDEGADVAEDGRRLREAGWQIRDFGSLTIAVRIVA